MNYIAISIFEIIVVSITIWLCFNEDKLIKLENKIISKFKRK